MKATLSQEDTTMKTIERTWMWAVTTVAMVALTGAMPQAQVLRVPFRIAAGDAARVAGVQGGRALGREAMAIAARTVDRDIAIQGARVAAVRAEAGVARRVAAEEARRSAEHVAARSAVSRAQTISTQPLPVAAPTRSARAPFAAAADTRGVSAAAEELRRVAGQVSGAARERVGVAIRTAELRLAEGAAQRRRAGSLRSAFAEVRDPGVVYVRVNRTTGQQYIGRSKSTFSYLKRQRAHDRRFGVLPPTTNRFATGHRYEVIAVAKAGPQLRVAEESAIRLRGGPAKGPRPGLANKRFEMTERDYAAAGGTVPMPRR
jgi:hypothetical protein